MSCARLSQRGRSNAVDGRRCCPTVPVGAAQLVHKSLRLLPQRTEQRGRRLSRGVVGGGARQGTPPARRRHDQVQACHPRSSQDVRGEELLRPYAWAAAARVRQVRFRSRPNLSRKVEPEEYFPHIDRYLAAHPDCSRIFVATDQRQWLKILEQAYPGKIVSFSKWSLSDSDENRFRDDAPGPPEGSRSSSTCCCSRAAAMS